MLTSDDPTYVIAPPFYWSVIESNIAVLAASIPSFKPLAKRFLPRLIGESSEKQSHTYANTDSYRAHYTGNSSSGFNKLGVHDAMKMKVFDRDNSQIGVARGGYPTAMQDHKQSTTSMSNSDIENDTTHHSNSSEEHIIQAGKGDIVMTKEFTRTVENRPRPKRAPQSDYYPGHD